jgi:hypothetical protein
MFSKDNYSAHGIKEQTQQPGDGCGTNGETHLPMAQGKSNRRLRGSISESSPMLPSSSIRIGMNAVGLLACGSSDLEAAFPVLLAPVALLLHSSPLTVAGPRRILTGFPYTESQMLYGSFRKVARFIYVTGDSYRCICLDCFRDNRHSTHKRSSWRLIDPRPSLAPRFRSRASVQPHARPPVSPLPANLFLNTAEWGHEKQISSRGHTSTGRVTVSS